MAQNFKIPMCAILLALSLVIYSCSNDEPFEHQQIEPEQTLTADSSIVEMMKRISSNDGSYDNIVDGASCVDIQFPYTVTVNGSEIPIESMEDLQKIEDIFDAAETENDTGSDDYSMEIAFPITINVADYTEYTVSSHEELLGHIENCVEGGGDVDMECIDLLYPVTVFSFDPSLQRTGSVTIDHDKELRRFLEGLAATELISFEFPMDFETFDGVELTVSDNTELVAALERVVAICDEDDDNDYNDDDFTQSSLDSLLVTCPWSVERLATSNQTVYEEYQEHLLIFNENGTLVSDNGHGVEEEGRWSVSVSDSKVFLELVLEDATEISGTRYTYEIGDGLIKGETDNGDTIILEQACGFLMEICEQDMIQENLLSEGCNWTVTDEEGDSIEDATIDFTDGNLVARDDKNELVDQGSWMITGNRISFIDLDDALEELGGDWEIVSCSEQRYILRRDDETVVLIRQCNDQSQDKY